jgi:hypothetical protein
MTCGTGRSRTIGNTAIGQHIGLLLCGFAGLAQPVRIGRALVLLYRRRQPVPDVIYAGDRELLVWGEARPHPDPAAPFLRQQTRLGGPIGPTAAPLADEISPVSEPAPTPTSSPLRPSRGEVIITNIEAPLFGTLVLGTIRGEIEPFRNGSMSPCRPKN